MLVHEFVTGGGLAGEALPPSWAAEGRAMRRALAEDFASLDGVRVTMTLDARLPEEPGPWHVVRVGPGEEPARFARLAAESDYTLCIAPETGGILEERARVIERAGGRSLGSSPGAIALCGDKMRMGEHLGRLGIETPVSLRVVPADGLPRDFPYPAVLKPIDGAGSLDTYFVESPDAEIEAARGMPEAMLQPFAAGEPMSASFLVVPEAGPILLGLADQRIERDGGEFNYRGGVVPSRVGPDRPAFDGLLEVVRSVPGLLGWVGVDFLWDEQGGRAVVLDVNPRPTTSYVGFREVVSPGLDPPSWMARLWMGRILGPGPEPGDPWCRRVSRGIPVAFGADGRVDRASDRGRLPRTGRPSYLALDIGGANLKAAHTSGAARSVPFALWKNPELLPSALAALTGSMPDADRWAVTMTGELCDCFSTKAEGVRAIINAVLDVGEKRKIRVWTTNGRFASASEVLEEPSTAAAANWLALATVAARFAADGLLIDVGSTTTDLIPIRDGRPVPRERTDTGRLRSGELVYAGVRRTPVCALATSLPHRGQATGLAAELFATTRDVYLTLGDLEEDPSDTDTADGRGATAEAARDRLARMIGADREGFSRADAVALARAADAALVARLVEAAGRVAREALGGPPGAAVISGSGEFLARRVAERVVAEGGSIASLGELWGPGASDAACACAVAILAAESEGGRVADEPSR